MKKLNLKILRLIVNSTKNKQYKGKILEALALFNRILSHFLSNKSQLAFCSSVKNNSLNLRSSCISKVGKVDLSGTQLSFLSHCLFKKIIYHTESLLQSYILLALFLTEVKREYKVARQSIDKFRNLSPD
jgi:hypothetical protein